MRGKYSIGLLLLAAVASASAEVCPTVVTAVASRVAALRGVPPPFSPPCRFVSQEALAEEIARKLRRDLPTSPELFVEALVRLGFVAGEPATLLPRLVDFYRQQVLGFYEPAGNELVIVQEAVAETGLASWIWAHELEHAAQEARFRLPSRLLAMGSNSDRQRAASAIAEGDALLVMLLLALPARAGGDPLDLAAEALSRQMGAQVAGAEVPEYFVQELLFPYTTGFATTLAAYRRGGWEAVDRLLASPPSSTAELLHPGRPPTPGLGDEVLPSPPPGTEVILTDTLGEWGFATWLAPRLGGEEAARVAAAWRGDRFLLLRHRHQPDHWALALEVACSDEEGCTLLQQALQAQAPALLARLTPEPPTLVWHRTGPRFGLRAAWPAAHETVPPGAHPPRQRSGRGAGASGTTTALVMITGSRGTSPGNGPPGPVGTAAMASTTSMPATTRPKTQ